MTAHHFTFKTSLCPRNFIITILLHLIGFVLSVFLYLKNVVNIKKEKKKNRDVKMSSTS